mmetsp:Transcript_42163/g.98889  ORF Transcript_42163/g.98889 Transcript_42163/m.98889 type:complete len:286 (+) Transcript_42163:126-983(+)|eukprot:CAMPEP_0178387110 /NCGR_PEP_ID=MMETSP0689_2-20121128/8906_1 /TAXON_ID=160604 /ORGANISM="Amphidinium massartii, Strain CS-259" /LENGTH=285 /DNA_ID=CAMNT_0020007467 /DNA_START=36 /DNA_END=893 /DNA_ORIENTATION=+
MPCWSGDEVAPAWRLAPTGNAAVIDADPFYERGPSEVEMLLNAAMGVCFTADAAAIAQRLSSRDSKVGQTALASICLSTPAHLQVRQGSLLDQLEGADRGGRWLALAALCKLHPEEQNAHEDAVARLLRDGHAEVRWMAMEALVQMGCIERHTPILVQLVGDPDQAVQQKAFDILKGLRTLDVHHAALGGWLNDRRPVVRADVMSLLGSLQQPEVLQQYVLSIAPHLNDADARVRKAALRVMQKMPSGTLTKHQKDILPYLDDAARRSEHAAGSAAGMVSHKSSE